MRLIATFSSQDDAHVFRDILYVKGMENDAEQNSEGTWDIWVYDEDRLEEAMTELKAFQSLPEDADFTEAIKEADKLRNEAEKEEVAATKRMKTREDLFKQSAATITFTLIVVSVLVAIVTQLGKNRELVNMLSIASMESDGNLIRWYGLSDIKHGQVWRVVTPIFLHFSFLHILFNMLWLRDLGGMIERVQGGLRLGLLVFVLAVLPNVAQYYVGGPGFGGMSGVVYGLLGYIWMQGRFDPGCGLFLHATTVNFMLIWFVICLLGFMPIANTVHAVGLGIGVAWGYVVARLKR